MITTVAQKKTKNKPTSIEIYSNSEFQEHKQTVLLTVNPSKILQKNKKF